MHTTIHHFLPRLGLAFLLTAWASRVANAEEFKQDFRGHPHDATKFRPTGSNHGRVVKSEARGLRITLPADHVNKLPVGLALATGVRGDFEITMEFELLHVEQPTAGYGAGASIYIATVAPSKDAATIARYVRLNGAQVFSAHRASTPDGGARKHWSEDLVTEAQSGKLRLIRTGTTLTYQIALGESNAFQGFHEAELGAEDLDVIRFAADNGGSPTEVGVRIKAVSIKADEFGPAQPLPPPSDWPFWLAAGLAILLLAAGGCWLWSRSQKDTRHGTSHAQSKR